MRSELGKAHARVIESAPDAMRPRLRQLAVDCLLRRYGRADVSERESVDCYLDAESLFQLESK